MLTLTTTTRHTQNRATSGSVNPGPCMRLCGRIFAPTTVAEVVNMLAVSGWEGDLHIRSGQTRYRLTLARGALIAAWSDAHEHRLGELLVRRRLLTREQLVECLRELGQGRRIGEILVDKGWIERTQLFAALKAQTERIFHDALLVASGRFAFTDSAIDELPRPISFHLPLQSLVLEAAQRLDEMKLYRTRIESDAVRPVLTGTANARELDPQTRRVAAHIDGVRSIGEIGERTELEEYHVTRAVYGLLESGLAAIQPSSSRSADDDLVALTRQFDGVLKLVFDAVGHGEAAGDVRARVAEWVAATGLDSVIGPELLPNGSIDSAHLRTAAAALGPEQALASAHQVLHDLTAFALLAAGPCLARQQEAELARCVYRHLRQINLSER